MCRLFGFIATEETRLDCSLVAAQNALVTQSDRDLQGRRSADGWGIAQWKTEAPEVMRSTYPAFADESFVDMASSVAGRVVIAHVRAATTGRVAIENTHPFHRGSWAFAHNGAITGIEHVATHLDIGMYGPPWGETDSELAFLWILNRMREYGLDPDSPSDDVGPIMQLIADSITDLIGISIASGAGSRPRLNFVISDGRSLVASRFGESLYWTFRRGVSDCTICGISHCEHADPSYKAVLVASEPISAGEHWHEIPEGTIFGVGPDVATTTLGLVTETVLTADR